MRGSKGRAQFTDFIWFELDSWWSGGKKEGKGVSGRGQDRRNILLNKKHQQRAQLICNSNYANKNLTQTK